MSAAHANALLAHAAVEVPHEACGLLLGAGLAVHEVRACANVADDPTRAFVLDPLQRFAAERAAREGGAGVLGWYHSHPSGDPAPSAADASCVRSGGALWLIVAGGRIAAYHSRIGGALHGRFDPVALRVR